MNYFEKIEKIDHILSPEWKEKYPYSWPILFDYVGYALIHKESNRTIKVSNSFRADFSKTRTFYNLSFLKRTILYSLTKEEKKISKKTLLLSSNLFHRFPKLTERLISSNDCLIMATRTNINFSKKNPLKKFLKVDSIIYTPTVQKALKLLMPTIKHNIAAYTQSNLSELKNILDVLETELASIVSNLAALIKKHNVQQFICPYCCRYEEILICLACKKLNIPSKEICHGVNSQKLIDSDNVVPTHADFLYVWSQQFYKNISSYGDASRIKICGYPKFNYQEIASFKEKFPQQKLITFFSQATYDVGRRSAEPLVKSFIENESEWRKNLFSLLKKIKDQHGYQIRVRYHPGEKNLDNYGCDRREEWKKIEKLGFEFSTNSLEQDLFESSLCLGINSSTLYEASILGRNVFQLRFEPTGKENYHSIIPIIDPLEIEEKLLETQNFQKEPCVKSLFDTKWFLEDEIKSSN